MPWSRGPNGGFTTGQPWLAARDTKRGGECRGPDCGSALYAVALRRAEPALSAGAYVPVAATDSVLVFERRYGHQRWLVALNTGGTEAHSCYSPLTGSTFDHRQQDFNDSSSDHRRSSR